MSCFDFSDKKFLVTGASSGLGKACASYLDACGASTVLVARDERAIKQLAASMDNPSLACCCDLSRTDAIEGVFRYAIEDGVKLDGVVHSAGIAPNIPISQFSETDAYQIFGVNFFSFCSMLMYCSKRKYLNKGGSIVAISSSSVLRGNKAQGLYVASKCALEGYVRIAAKELIEKNIRVNAIQPAALDTPLTRAVFEESPIAAENFRATQKLGIIEPEILSEFIAFLLSDKSRYMTGLSIPVDAGAMYCSGI